MSRSRLRNHYAVEAHFRHAGPHGKTAKAMRRKHHVEEHRAKSHREDEYGEVDAPIAYVSAREAMRHYNEEN